MLLSNYLLSNYLFFYFYFIMQGVKTRAITCPHLLPIYKQGLALNYSQGLICHKTQPNLNETSVHKFQPNFQKVLNYI